MSKKSTNENQTIKEDGVRIDISDEIKTPIDNLSKLVQIEEYRAELERLRLEKEGIRVPPFRYKQE